MPAAFHSINSFDWRQTAKAISAGDTVYIYAGRQIQAITHNCQVMEVNVPYGESDDFDMPYNLISGGQAPGAGAR